MEPTWKKDNNQTQPSKPHNLELYPKEELMAHKRHKGGNRNPKPTQNIVNTPWKSPRNQKHQLPVAKQLAQQTTKQTQQGENKKSERTKCKPEK